MSTLVGPNQRRPFRIWDVFTKRPFTGNPLAIFPTAEGLTATEMQKLAREANLSESIFLFRAAEDRISHRSAWIFTPERELPFAGHPVLGAALFLNSETGASAITLETKSGPVPVTITQNESGMFGEMRQAEPEFRVLQIDPLQLAGGIGISPDELHANFPAQVISTGLPYMIIPVRDAAVLPRVSVDWARATPFRANFEESPSLYFVAVDGGRSGARLRARCLDPEREDPATGSAAGCAAAWMLALHIAGDGEQVTIQQGAGLGRPSEIFVRASRSPQGHTDIRVGGHAIETGRGEYFWRAADDEPDEYL